jgi:hypothetical protein
MINDNNKVKVLFQNHTYVAEDFKEEVEKYTTEDGFYALNHTIQFPYTSAKVNHYQ